MRLTSLIVLILLILSSGCATPTLTTFGPKWQLRAGCELKTKSNDWYANVEPESKCGVGLDIVILQGGK